MSYNRLQYLIMMPKKHTVFSVSDRKRRKKNCSNHASDAKYRKITANQLLIEQLLQTDI